MSACLQTGQITCHDEMGRLIDCTGGGQDAEFKSGVSRPAPRFEVLDDTVLDRLTRLVWTRNANMAEFALTWQEALDYIATMNRDKVSGSLDWRLLNRRQLRSLMSHQTRKPALPEGHLCQRLQRMVLDVHDCGYQHCLCMVYPYGGRTNVLRPEGAVFPIMACSRKGGHNSLCYRPEPVL